MMVELVKPRPDDVICDPAFGSAGFLIAAATYLKENCKQEVFFDRKNKDHYMNHMFHGFDMDRTMLRIGAMNMMTHGVDNPFIEYRDSLSDQNPDKDKYSLILANPPSRAVWTTTLFPPTCSSSARPKRPSCCSSLCSCGC